MKTWFLFYVMTLGNGDYHEVEFVIEMPDEATCLQLLNSDVYASEVLAGPPDPNNPRGLHRALTMRGKRCEDGYFEK